MFSGAHILLYSPDAGADRAFVRDVLGLRFVDIHDGWLVFRLPPAELGVHPTMADGAARGHALWLMCEDIEAAVAALRAKGVEISRPVRDEGFGLTAAMRLPSGVELAFYQPRHPLAYNLEDRPAESEPSTPPRSAGGGGP